MIWLLLLLSLQLVRLATHRKTEKERQLADGRVWEGGGLGAELYDRKKAWPSMNHSMLSEGKGQIELCQHVFLFTYRARQSGKVSLCRRVLNVDEGGGQCESLPTMEEEGSVFGGGGGLRRDRGGALYSVHPPV